MAVQVLLCVTVINLSQASLMLSLSNTRAHLLFLSPHSSIPPTLLLSVYLSPSSLFLILSPPHIYLPFNDIAELLQSFSSIPFLSYFLFLFRLLSYLYFPHLFCLHVFLLLPPFLSVFLLPLLVLWNKASDLEVPSHDVILKDTPRCFSIRVFIQIYSHGSKFSLLSEDIQHQRHVLVCNLRVLGSLCSKFPSRTDAM